MGLAQRIRRHFLVDSSIMSTDFDRRQLAREAKAIVALAFRNGPIEDIHAGRPCPTCAGQAGYSRITDAGMKSIIKNAVDHVYARSRSRTNRQRSTKRRFNSEADTPERGMEPGMPEPRQARSEPLPR